MSVIKTESLFKKWFIESAGFTSQFSMTFAAKTVILIAGFALSIIMARHLGAEGLGTYTVLITIAAIGGQFGSFGLHTANTYFVARERGLLPGIMGNTIWFSLVGGMMAGLVLIVVLHFYPNLAAGISTGLLLLSLLSVPFNLLFMLGQSVLLGMQKIMAYNFFELLGRLAPFTAITLLMFYKQGIGLVMVATVLSSVVFSLAVVKKLYPGGRPILDVVLFKKMLVYGLKIYLACIFAFLLLRFDLMMVNCFLGAGEAGVYSIAALIGDVLCMLPGVAGMILFPRVSGMRGGRSWGFTAGVAWLTAAVMLVACLAAALLAGPFVAFFYGGAFEEAVAALWWLLPGIFGLSVNTIFMNYFAGRGMPPVMVISPLLALILNISLNLYFIPVYGIKGAAFTSSVAYFVALIMSLSYLKVCLRRKTNEDEFVCDPSSVG